MEKKPAPEVEKIIHYWPYCQTCERPFSFDEDEPFAHCACGTTEWGYPRPAPYIRDPNRDISNHTTLTQVIKGHKDHQIFRDYLLLITKNMEAMTVRVAPKQLGKKK